MEMIYLDLKVIRANVIIMYELMHLGEDAKNNKTYVHYLEVDDKEIINYQRPDPFKGYIITIQCQLNVMTRIP